VARRKRGYELKSHAETLHALRYMGAEAARIEMPMLHPDHIRWASILLVGLADDLRHIATSRASNISKIFSARMAIYSINRDLRAYARDDIERIRKHNRQL